ncbi:hypothetical protein GpartN1_g2153.t1 [Galdieria partita]|uniref:ABC1 atypical kinase-like domain-containing protein n=1 Tax=Galdieria partita TaxID=83374 RepID=A0A9C7PVG9_9RHOD|nr:hypothetical protein GpartN1_g2153.t1 [Galdieria partita]
MIGHTRRCCGFCCSSCWEPLRKANKTYYQWIKSNSYHLRWHKHKYPGIIRLSTGHQFFNLLALQSPVQLPVKDTQVVKNQKTSNPQSIQDQDKSRSSRLHPERTIQQVLDRGIAYAMGLYDNRLSGMELFKQDIRYWLSQWKYFGRKAFLTYDKEEIISYYDRRPWIVAARWISVGIPLLHWYIKLLWDQLLSGGNTIHLSWRARELVQLVIKLGPAFIKVAQALSSRPDIVGPVWIKELEKLVDKVDPFPSDWARRLVTAEIQGTLWEKRLYQVSVEPVASASLGQVYQGLCQREDGKYEKIALKVQRPGLIFDIPLDLYILRSIAGLVRRQFRLRSDLVGILDEYAQQIFEEMDYQHEGENCMQFRWLYRNYPGICIPSVYFTSHYLIALEWIEGDKPPWGSYSKSLMKIGVEFSLHQLLDVGFYHADPHAGNLLRTPDNCLAYVDYGMVRYLDRNTRWHLIKAIIDFVNKDFDGLIEEFVILGFLPFQVNEKGIIEGLEVAFKDASTDGRLSKLNFSRLAQNLGVVARSYPIQIPPKFALVIRCLTMLEGLALQNDPSFHIVEKAYPFILERLFSSDSSILPPHALRDILLDSRTGKIRWKRLWQMVELSNNKGGDDGHRLEDGTEKRGPFSVNEWLPVLIDGKQVIVSRTFFEDVVRFLLSQRAEFLRDGLAEEMADVLDDLQLVIGNSASVISMGFIPRPRERPNRERLARLWHWIQTKRKADYRKIPKPMTVEEWLVVYLFQYMIRSSSSFRSWLELGYEAQRTCRILVGRWIEKNNQRLWDLLSDIVEENQ